MAAILPVWWPYTHPGIIAMNTKKNPAVLEAIVKGGGPSELARKLSALHPDRPRLTPQAISVWRRSGQLPPARVLDVEKVTKVSRFDLRPDYYPRRARA